MQNAQITLRIEQELYDSIEEMKGEKIEVLS